MKISSIAFSFSKCFTKRSEIKVEKKKMKMSKHFPNSGLFQKKNHQNSTENARLCGFLKDSGFISAFARGSLVCKSLEPYLERYQVAPFLYYIPAQTPP